MWACATPSSESRVPLGRGPRRGYARPTCASHAQSTTPTSQTPNLIRMSSGSAVPRGVAYATKSASDARSLTHARNQTPTSQTPQTDFRRHQALPCPAEPHTRPSRQTMPGAKRHARARSQPLRPPHRSKTPRTNHHSPISQQTCQRHTSRHRPLAADSVSDELPAASQGHSTHCKSRAAHPPRT